MIKSQIPEYIIIWCYKFITNSKFKVKINQTISEAKEIETDVPQGAVLRSILFSIFINDTPINDNTNNEYNLLFADDICYLKLFKSTLGVEKNVNLYLKQLQNWFNRWRLKMATHKCAAMIIESQNSNQPFEFRMYYE
jgi:hypothetical protein